MSTAGDEAVELAAHAGLNLYPWQQLVLRDGLSETAGGKWAAFEVGLICPRQNGKGSILEALELAALFLADPDAPPPLILHSAHEFKTSAEHFRRVRDLVEGSEMFSKQVRIIRTASGAEAIELHSGARLRFVTRSGGSGRGFSADLVVIDEAYNLTPEQMGAILPTLSARPNPQVWYTSSAGMISSAQLAHIRRRGLAGGDPSLAFFEWSAEDGADLDDHAAWAQANPSLGYRIPESFIVRERAALPDEQFGRERLGLWADDLKLTGPIPLAAWIEQEDPGSAPESPTGVCFAVAVAQDRSWSCIASSGRRADGSDHVEIVANQRGTAWVADWFTDPERNRVAEYQPCAIVVNPAGPEGSLIADLTERGVDVVQPSARELGQAFGMFYDGVMVEKTLRHRPDALLARALEAARDRPLGDAKTWDQRGSTDISPIVAATNALWGFNVHGAERSPVIW